MKKLIMMFAFLSFAAIGSMNAQACHSAKAEGKSCCAKKAEGTTSASVEGAGMVKKVANTSEAASCTKTAGTKACCAKDKAASCSKTTDATAPKQTKVVNVADRKDAAPMANE